LPTPVSALIHAATMVYNSGENNENIHKNKLNLNPWYVTGYTDGDGSFSIRLRKSSDSKFGYKIIPVFSIGAQNNPNNTELLEKVKDFFGGVGWISSSDNMKHYEVTSLDSLKIIRKHFETYHLETSKHIYFLLWCRVMDLLEKKTHHTLDGFINVLAIKAVFPKGLSKDVLINYPNIVPIQKPEFLSNTSPLNPNWISGFVQADGTFGLNYIKSSRSKLGYTCQPQFRVTQHERDLVILKRIITAMGCGNLINPSGGRDRYDVSVANIKDITLLIIPFFEKYPIYGAKLLDFQDFCQGITIIKNKEHLTQQGLDHLKDLAYNMNTYRKF